jgi:hypothetical protein
LRKKESEAIIASDDQLDRHKLRDPPTGVDKGSRRLVCNHSGLSAIEENFFV